MWSCHDEKFAAGNERKVWVSLVCCNHCAVTGPSQQVSLGKIAENTRHGGIGMTLLLNGVPNIVFLFMRKPLSLSAEAVIYLP